MKTQIDYYYERKKTPGVCLNCGKPSGKSSRCGKCRKTANDVNKKLYQARRAKGLCNSCGKPSAKLTYCEVCKVRQSDMQKAARRRLKEEVLARYGKACQCCGEDEILFLQIDHVANDGAAHRKVVPSGQLYKWLKKQNFPPGFQTLCANCNFAKRMGGCPHQATPTVPVCRSTSR